MIPARTYSLTAATIRRVFVGSRDSFEAMNRAIAVNRIHPVIDRVFAFLKFTTPTDMRRKGRRSGRSSSRGRNDSRGESQWVVEKSYSFKPAGNTDEHNRVVKFFWLMLPKDGGPVASRGLDIFVLREDGRIRALYQFPEPAPA